MLASITSTVFIRLITYSTKLYFFFFTNFPIPELPFLSTKPQHPFLSPLSLDICIRSFQSNQFCSVAQSCLTLCNSMDWSSPGFPVHHHLPELAQTHVHQVSNAIQPSHPLLSPSPPTFNLSQHRGLFQVVSSSHQVAKVLEFQPQHQNLQWTFRTNFP